MDNSVIGRLMTEALDAGTLPLPSRRRGHLAERVLSAQVLQALDFLPRTTFLGQVLADAKGADAARADVLAEVEDLSILFLPDVTSGPDARSQPDAWISGPTTGCLVQGKAPRSTFSRGQLRRNYRSLLRRTRGRIPLMLLIVEDPERITVWGKPGAHSVLDALEWELEHAGEAAGTVGESPVRVAAARTGGTVTQLRADEVTATDLEASDVAAWTTWDQVARSVTSAAACLEIDDASVRAALGRQVDALVHAVARHARSSA